MANVVSIRHLVHILILDTVFTCPKVWEIRLRIFPRDWWDAHRLRLPSPSHRHGPNHCLSLVAAPRRIHFQPELHSRIQCTMNVSIIVAVHLLWVVVCRFPSRPSPQIHLLHKPIIGEEQDIGKLPACENRTMKICIRCILNVFLEPLENRSWYES